MRLLLHRAVSALRWSAGALALGLAATGASAQPCVPGFEDAFQQWDFNNRVAAYAVFDDDGAGPNPPKLYAAGTFTAVGTQTVNRIAAWDGTRWSPVGAGGGLNNIAYALRVYDDGTGPALYVGGDFTIAGGVTANRVAKWNGTAWSSLGSGTANGVNASVFALGVYDDDGAGPNRPSLYAGGNLTQAGGAAASRIARWNGTAWSALGAGADNTVNALTTYTVDGVEQLYAAGSFLNAGGASRLRIARWNGAAWSSLPGNGTNGIVRALSVFGGQLYAGGDFTIAGPVSANRIARWDGATWQDLAGGVAAPVYSLAPYDDGGGPAIWVGGTFLNAAGTGANYVAKFNGTAWASPAGGANGAVLAIAPYDDGGGQRVYVGGDFSSAGTDATAAARSASWDGQNWAGLSKGVDGSVYAAVSSTVSGTRALYIGGSFSRVAGVAASNIAVYDGTNWHALGAGLNNSVFSLTEYNDGTGPALYAGGSFTTSGATALNRIARWDGAAWSRLGPQATPGVNNTVNALTVFNDGAGAALYLGGTFTAATGNNPPLLRVAKWNGSAFTQAGDGLNATVSALSPYNGSLFAGGNFTSNGAAAGTLNRVARLAGGVWTSLGAGASNGVNNTVYALAVWNDGTGSRLYVGGLFTNAGTVSTNRIGSWNGTAWSDVGGGVNNTVRVLGTFDDGNGVGLYAGGAFTAAGLSNPARIARFDRVNGWTTLGAGADGTVFALANFSPGVLQTLYFGGDFLNLGTLSSSRIAAYTGCAPACPPDYDRSGEVNANDISSYLNGWYGDIIGGTTNADFDRTGETDANDISAFLNEWFAAIVNGGTCG